MVHIWDAGCLWFVDDNEDFFYRWYDLGDKCQGQRSSYFTVFYRSADTCDGPTLSIDPFMHINCFWNYFII